MLVMRLVDRGSIRVGIVKVFATMVVRIINCSGACHVFHVVFEVVFARSKRIIKGRVLHIVDLKNPVLSS